MEREQRITVLLQPATLTVLVLKALEDPFHAFGPTVIQSVTGKIGSWLFGNALCTDY